MDRIFCLYKRLAGVIDCKESKKILFFRVVHTRSVSISAEEPAVMISTGSRLWEMIRPFGDTIEARQLEVPKSITR